jgi:two-component system, NarL family, response regulator NreC
LRRSDRAAAIEETNRLKRHVVVLNLVMPVLNGLEAAKVIKVKSPGIGDRHIVADEEFVKQAMKAGAHAYVSKSRAGDALIQAIEAAPQGGEFVFVK